MVFSFLGSLRQVLCYPDEFWIGAPEWPGVSKSTERLVTLLQTVLPETDLRRGKNEQELLLLIADIGTGLWRIQRRLTSSSAESWGGDVKRLTRDLEATLDALRQGGIEIKDHTGEKYDTGMALRVITFQPVAELSCEKVIETIRPTIYYKDRIVRMGEVIVGKPEETIAQKTAGQK
jgi:hypothetical protein